MSIYEWFTGTCVYILFYPRSGLVPTNIAIQLSRFTFRVIYLHTLSQAPLFRIWFLRKATDFHENLDHEIRHFQQQNKQQNNLII